MEKDFELSKLSNATLLELSKKINEYVTFLDKEKSLKSTEEK